MLETTVRKPDIEGDLRLVSVPALAGGDLAEQLANQIAASLRIFQPQEEITRHGKIIPAQNEALNVTGVEFTHCDRLS